MILRGLGTLGYTDAMIASGIGDWGPNGPIDTPPEPWYSRGGGISPYGGAWNVYDTYANKGMRFDPARGLMWEWIAPASVMRPGPVYYDPAQGYDPAAVDGFGSPLDPGWYVITYSWSESPVATYTPTTPIYDTVPGYWTSFPGTPQGLAQTAYEGWVQYGQPDPGLVDWGVVAQGIGFILALPSIVSAISNFAPLDLTNIPLEESGAFPVDATELATNQAAIDAAASVPTVLYAPEPVPEIAPAPVPEPTTIPLEEPAAFPVDQTAQAATQAEIDAAASVPTVSYAPEPVPEPVPEISTAPTPEPIIEPAPLPETTLPDVTNIPLEEPAAFPATSEVQTAIQEYIDTAINVPAPAPTASMLSSQDAIEAIYNAMEDTGTATASEAANALGFNSVDSMVASVNPAWVSTAVENLTLSEINAQKAAEAARIEAERQAAEQAAFEQAQAEAAAQQAAAEEAARQAAEQAAFEEAQRQAAEEAARLEAERAAEQAAANQAAQEYASTYTAPALEEAGMFPADAAELAANQAAIDAATAGAITTGTIMSAGSAAASALKTGASLLSAGATVARILGGSNQTALPFSPMTNALGPGTVATYSGAVPVASSSQIAQSMLPLIAGFGLIALATRPKKARKTK